MFQKTDKSLCVVLMYELSSYSEVGLVHVHVDIFACTCSTKFKGKVKGGCVSQRRKGEKGMSLIKFSST